MEQVVDLYGRFPSVKTYYDFVFNPKEDVLMQEAKAKISNEYFPVRRKRPKARRSVAQKYIKHFLTLGVDSVLLADFMLYNLEVAQRFSIHKNVNDAFYKSLLKSFGQLMQYVSVNGLWSEFQERIREVYLFVHDKDWPNREQFSWTVDRLGPRDGL